MLNQSKWSTMVTFVTPTIDSYITQKGSLLKLQTAFVFSPLNLIGYNRGHAPVVSAQKYSIAKELRGKGQCVSWQTTPDHLISLSWSLIGIFTLQETIYDDLVNSNSELHSVRIHLCAVKRSQPEPTKAQFRNLTKGNINNWHTWLSFDSHKK